MYARSRRPNKARLNRMIEMQKNAHPILDESSGQGERFFCGMRKRGCKSTSGILLHPLRQCIGGLLLLFFGGERRGAVTLLGAVAAETGVAAAFQNHFGRIGRDVPMILSADFIIKLCDGNCKGDSSQKIRQENCGKMPTGRMCLRLAAGCGRMEKTHRRKTAMPFLMIRNDITRVEADAIVNPANPALLQGSGTSRAIYQAAGETELTAACKAIGDCAPGGAVCTPAFGLPAKYIFHTVCPAWHGGTAGEAQQLAGAYRAALELAVEYHCESVAVPLLSTGNYGYPKEQAFRIAADVITRFVLEHDLTVYLVLYDRESLATGQKLFADVAEYIDDHYVAGKDESYWFGRRRGRQEPEAVFAQPEVAMPERPAAPAAPGSLQSLMDNLGESFAARLVRLIDERELKDSTVYKRANISRQLFSKILCSTNYNPKKKTVLAFAVGLRLTEQETTDLLKSAGYAFSDSSKQDWIVRYCLEHKIYNINQINALLFEYDQDQLGN